MRKGGGGGGEKEGKGREGRREGEVGRGNMREWVRKWEVKEREG